MVWVQGTPQAQFPQTGSDVDIPGPVSELQPSKAHRDCLQPTAAERTLHSVHAISNTKSIRNSILLSQPCLNTNQNSHSHNPTQAT
ncbi:hypothetical protein D4764_0116080 [Takifugu flavidus]|uniref:Uncharacterized protein n=1 Tax=Takifugu flavidus TaxID=433684 RepID=A0A5C6MG12_9TELE|nr:hypothetical protein D4764_0116080 [Takifugu flavidus]